MRERGYQKGIAYETDNNCGMEEEKEEIRRVRRGHTKNKNQVLEEMEDKN